MQHTDTHTHTHTHIHTHTHTPVGKIKFKLLISDFFATFYNFFGFFGAVCPAISNSALIFANFESDKFSAFILRVCAS